MVVILEVGDDIELSIERIIRILDRFPQVSILATSKDKSSEAILKIMRSGATEYLLRPVVETDLAFALQKLGRLWLTKPVPEGDVGRIFTVFSPKGGVGVTTVAVNLATNIYESTKKPTIIVDLDLNAGDVTTFLNMKPTYTMTDVKANISRLDKSFLQGVIAKHDSGIFVLAGPQRVEEGVSISGAEINKVLSILKTMFSFIIIDAETIFESSMTALKMSDKVFLVFTMDLPQIRNIKKYLDFFQEMGFGNDNMKLIANRYIKKGEIKIEDAEKAINYPIFRTLPNEYNAAMSCVNHGVPLSVGAKKSQLNESIKELTKTIITNKK
jgi:pilus assembly protein CpaE